MAYYNKLWFLGVSLSAVLFSACEYPAYNQSTNSSSVHKTAALHQDGDNEIISNKQKIRSVLFNEEKGNVTVIDAVAISVNGQIINASEIFYPISTSLSELAKQSANRDVFISSAAPVLQNEILRQIGQVLVEQNAKEKLTQGELDYFDSQVEEHIKTLALRSGGSMNKLNAELIANGTSLEAVRITSKRELLSQYYLHQKLNSKLKFTRREILKYYKSHKDDFSSEAMVRMQIMYFPYESYSDIDTARNTAQAVYDRVLEGADFTEIIKTESVSRSYRSGNGGLWDMMPAGSFREKAVEDAAFTQGQGQISQPLQGQKGWFLVKTVDLQAATNISFEDAQPQILEKLTSEKNSRLAMELYIRLQDEAQIRHSTDFQEYALKLAADIYFAASNAEKQGE